MIDDQQRAAVHEVVSKLSALEYEGRVASVLIIAMDEKGMTLTQKAYLNVQRPMLIAAVACVAADLVDAQRASLVPPPEGWV